MNGGHTTIHRRINIALPEETIGLIERVTEKENRSGFIDEAVRHYIDAMNRANIRRRLQKGAARHAQRDERLAEEWFLLEEEAWQGSRA